MHGEWDGGYATGLRGGGRSMMWTVEEAATTANDCSRDWLLEIAISPDAGVGFSGEGNLPFWIAGVAVCAAVRCWDANMALPPIHISLLDLVEACCACVAVCAVCSMVRPAVRVLRLCAVMPIRRAITNPCNMQMNRSLGVMLLVLSFLCP